MQGHIPTGRLTTVFDVTDFGAVPDGRVMNTNAFREAINACAQAGGGTVYVPSGIYLTGPIPLRSNITLYLENGSRVVFSNRIEDYHLVETYWEGKECRAYSSLIFAEDAENIAITGRGVLDGNGSLWWDLHMERALEFPRPRFIGLQHCRNILIEGITLKNSPSWTINPVYCENIVVDKVTIINPPDSPNTDGINPDSCKNVHISNCHVDVGDDCITIKSGTEARNPKVPCQNITVTNCTMVHGHGGVVIGSEMSGGVSNVTISNCIFQGTDRGIRIKTRRGRGGVVEDIRVTNIIMKKVICPFVINMYYKCGTSESDKWVWDETPYPVNDGTPKIRDIHFSNITAKEVGAAAGFICGLSEMPVENISFSNIYVGMAENPSPGNPAMMHNIIPMSKQGFICKYAKNIEFSRIKIIGNEGPVYCEKGTQGIQFTGE